MSSPGPYRTPPSRRRSGASGSIAGDGGTELSEWVQLGPGRSALSAAIDRMPEKEEEIVFVRQREFEHTMTATLKHIKNLAETA